MQPKQYYEDSKIEDLMMDWTCIWVWENKM